MLIVYIIFSFFIVVALITAIIGFRQPQQFKHTESILITGQNDEILKQVSHYANFIQWSPWSEKDPAMKQVIPENDGEIGAKYTWSGNRQVGFGSMTLVSVTSDQVTHDLIFGKRPASQAIFSITPKENAYEVSWILSTDMGSNPIGRAFSPLMKKMIGKDFQQGLSNLKKRIEHV